jgi:monoamine oxidase
MSSEFGGNWDIVIIGAGLAGLHCALRLSRAKPNARILVAESYHYIGGRVVTYRKHGFQWENGAGRIHRSHRMVLNYLKKYGLHTHPITPTTEWRSITEGFAQHPRQNGWPNLAALIHDLLKPLSPSVLATHTIGQLLTHITGKDKAKQILAHFPYYSEVWDMRADMALDSFAHEMGEEGHFMVVKEGLSALTEAMSDEARDRGVEFAFGKRLIRVGADGNPHFADGTTVRTRQLILAIQSEAISKITPFTRLPALRHIVMTPLLRIYAVFPVREGKPWFHDIPRTVTDSPLRYVIPINPAKGTIMISYTDGKDAAKWQRVHALEGEEEVKERIMEGARELFPEKHIPAPTFFKLHSWSEGCSYWRPGLYNPAEVSQTIMRPLPHRLSQVYVCGESYSMRQCWMEGALEHAEEMLKRFLL